MEHLRMADIVATGDFSSPRRDVLSILWAITKVCNYRCSYCVYYKTAKNAEFSSRDDLLRAARSILRLGRPGYQITLYGGEPTFHPHCLDLLAYLAGSGAPVSLRMYTNGSKPVAYFEKMAAMVAGAPFGIIFSLHHEFAHFAKFKHIVEIVAGAGVSVGVSAMFLPALAERARDCIGELLALRARVPFFMSINLPYTPDGVLGDGCSADHLAWIEASRQAFARIPMPGELVSPFFARILSNITVERRGKRKILPPEESGKLLHELNTPSYRGFYCCGGANVLFIEEDGAVRGGVCSASTHMGNIFHDSEIAVMQRADVVCCTSAACGSIENIPLPKFRDAAEAQACMDDVKRRAKGYLYRAEAARLEGPPAIPQA